MTNHALLTGESHRALRVSTARGADLGDAVMSCLTVPTEFRQIQGAYPILFRLGDDRETFTALAMFGFENGENLFLDGDRWDADYVPLAIAIQPFLIGGAGAQDAAKQIHIDMASPRLGHDDGVLLFDEHLRATPYLDRVAEQLGMLDEGYGLSAEFFAALRHHELLEPLTLEITLDDGTVNRLVGFHVIDEERLRTLDAAALGALHDAGQLLPIFMAVASIGRLNDLVARKNRTLAHG